jgi:hypothetical protein
MQFGQHTVKGNGADGAVAFKASGYRKTGTDQDHARIVQDQSGGTVTITRRQGFAQLSHAPVVVLEDDIFDLFGECLHKTKYMLLNGFFNRLI